MAVEGEGVGGMGDAEEPGASYRGLALFLFKHFATAITC